MGERLTLYVCQIGDDGPLPHVRKRARRALRDAGHELDKLIAWARESSPR